MNRLQDFFKEERKRVFEPDAFFTARVMARMKERPLADTGIWEVVPSSSRPVFALAVMLILCFALVELFVPATPQRGMIESYLAPEQNPAESFLYTEAAEVPTDNEVLHQLIALEDSQ